MIREIPFGIQEVWNCLQTIEYCVYQDLTLKTVRCLLCCLEVKEKRIGEWLTRESKCSAKSRGGSSTSAPGASGQFWELYQMGFSRSALEQRDNYTTKCRYHGHLTLCWLPGTVSRPMLNDLIPDSVINADAVRPACPPPFRVNCRATVRLRTQPIYLFVRCFLGGQLSSVY